MSREKVKGSELGQLIRQVRLARGLSQAEFARIIRMSRDAVQSYELGRITPKAAPLSRILRLAPAALVQPLRKHLMPMANDLMEESLEEKITPETEFRSNAMQLMRRKLDEMDAAFETLRQARNEFFHGKNSRLSAETVVALHEALDVILERAPDTTIEEITETLTRFAGRFGDPQLTPDKKLR